MAGLFDDIPSAAKAGGGLFDDIRPDPVASLDFSPVATDWKAAKSMIDALPEDIRGRARDKYADMVVSSERQKGGIGQTVDDYMRRFASSVPGVGAWADEGNAYLASLFGGDYDMAHAYERAKDRAIEQTETAKLGTLPIIGTEVTSGGLTKAAGLVSGAIAMPYGRLMGGAGAVPTAINVGGNAAIYGALDRAGNADAGNRVEAAKEGATDGALFGAPMGFVFGKIASRGAPVASNQVAAAAERIGVDLPRVAAAGDSIAERGTKEVAAGLASIPFVGTPIGKAAGKAIDQLDDAATRIADSYSSGASTKSAGEAVRDSIAGWIKGDSVRMSEALYREVGNAIPAGAFAPLANTAKAAAKLGADDLAAASKVNKPAIDMVAEALKVPGGLSFEGMMRLRTNIGAMLDDGLLPAAGTTKPALKQLYASLTKDLEGMAFQFGGQRGFDAWRKANRIADQIADRREVLTKIIGNDGTRAGESVVDQLVRMAGTQSSADLMKLHAARKAVGSAWDEVSAAAIQRLGRDTGDAFSPAIFLRKYTALSDKGRQLLFDSTGKGALKAQLDDLATVAKKFEELSRLRNTSNTGRVNAILGLGGALGAAQFGMLIPALKVAIPGHIAARMMAKPAKVKAISAFASALYSAASGKAGGVAQSAIAQLAAAIADESGEDQASVERRISAMFARGR